MVEDFSILPTLPAHDDTVDIRHSVYIISFLCKNKFASRGFYQYILLISLRELYLGNNQISIL